MMDIRSNSQCGAARYESGKKIPQFSVKARSFFRKNLRTISSHACSTLLSIENTDSEVPVVHMTAAPS